MTEENDLAQKFIQQLEDLKKKKGNNLGLTDIRLLVDDLTQKNDQSLYKKILAIAVKIHHLKDDFAGIDADKLTGDYLPKANLRLDAVVAATEKATHDILDATEKIQNSLKLAENPIIKEQTFKIVEACTFQDLTSQHISNVVSTLEEVDILVKAIIKILPEDFKKSVKEEAKKTVSLKDYEKNLAQGPQIGDVPTQDEIDKLFAES